jgi:hypothetical protein
MTGGIAPTSAAPEALAQFVMDADVVARWAREAGPGDAIVYARAEHLPPRCATAAIVRRLMAEHKVVLRQTRLADGRTDYWIRRKAPIRSAARHTIKSDRPALNGNALKVLRYLRAVARSGGVCPPYATIGRKAGVGTVEQARYAERKLREAGELSSEVLDAATGLRVVTFRDGLSTARPEGAR